VKKLTNIMKIGTFILVFCILFNEISYILMNKEVSWSILPIRYEDKLDVIALGSSTNEAAFIPMKLWNDYGIVSFNAAHPGGDLKSYYYKTKEYIDRFSAKVIFVEIMHFEKIIDEEDIKIEMHKMVDNWENSKVKWEYILSYPIEDRLELIFNIILYHSNWKDFNDIRYGINYDKCIDYRVRNFEGFDVDLADTEEKYDIPDENKKWLEKIVKLGKEKDVKIVFLALPTCENNFRAYANGIEEFCKNIDVDFINFYKLADEIDFQFSQDMDDWLHVNVNGAKKITEYLENYLIENNLVIDRKNDPEFSEWHEYYEKSDYKKYYEGEVITHSYEL